MKTAQEWTEIFLKKCVVKSYQMASDWEISEFVHAVQQDAILSDGTPGTEGPCVGPRNPSVAEETLATLRRIEFRLSNLGFRPVGPIFKP